MRHLIHEYEQKDNDDDGADKTAHGNLLVWVLVQIYIRVMSNFDNWRNTSKNAVFLLWIDWGAVAICIFGGVDSDL